MEASRPGKPAAAPAGQAAPSASLQGIGPARFRSLLFEEGPHVLERKEPSFFHDLRLDLVVESATAGREEYDLAPFFYTPLHDPGQVRYRQEILRDLERPEVRAVVDAFAGRMRTMRRYLALLEKLHHRYQKARWFLDAVEVYLGTVTSLAAELRVLELRSRGLRAFREYLDVYTGSDRFTSLEAETRGLEESLAEVRYALHIRGGRVTVRRYEGEPDYSSEVEATFAKFRQGTGKDHRVRLPEFADMDHVEARILELVARLYPRIFSRLEGYWAGHRDYLDPTVGRFDREVQFYLAYLDHIAPLRSAGLPLCYPEVSDRSKEVRVQQAFDLALAGQLLPQGEDVVRNDFFLREPERIIVVTGPNQGGKTTFARMFGQLHHLAGLGLPVPAEEARLYLPDRMFTHFEREEELATLRGKLEDELVRVRDILERATGRSVLIMNETLASTTLEDALYLGTEVLRRIIDLGSLCVYVTFVDELASLGPATVSMVATVRPDDPASRTYEIVRRPADGLAYASAIAGKYGLTYASVKRRVAR